MKLHCIASNRVQFNILLIELNVLGTVAIKSVYQIDFLFCCLTSMGIV